VITLDGQAPFSVSDSETAQQIEAIYSVKSSEGLSRDDLLATVLPAPGHEQSFQTAIDDFKGTIQQSVREGLIDELDAVLADAFQLTAAELELIQTDVETDELFKKLEPPLPYHNRILRGLHPTWGQSDRYKHVGQQSRGGSK
jgi:hypothetical protein